ncbi:MAG: hypothetical protein FWG55_01545 [Candidatus Bathyarchaeota archaeon]|nr:hypothetical protein [Candidatus Termiticorpusculum sp.]
MIKRKINTTLSGSYRITLPMKWVKKNNYPKEVILKVGKELKITAIREEATSC